MSSGQQIAGHDMPIATVKQLCKSSPILTSDSLVEQVAQLENFRELAKTGSEFFKRNHFTDGQSGSWSEASNGSLVAATRDRSISPRRWAQRNTLGASMRFSTWPPKSRFRLAPFGQIESSMNGEKSLG